MCVATEILHRSSLYWLIQIPNLEFYPVKQLIKDRIKTFSEMQYFRKFPSHAPFLSRLRKEKGMHGRQNNGPPTEDVQVLTCRICEYGILTSQKEIFWWGDYPGFIKWAQFNHKGPYEWKRERRETELEIWRCYKAGFEVGESSHEPKNVGGL